MSDAPAEIVAAEPAARGERRRLLIDLASSYALSIARVASNAVVIGVLYRYTTPSWVAAYVLIRSILVIVTYCCAGLSVATLREMLRPPTTRPSPVEIPPANGVLDYAAPSVGNQPADERPASRRFNALFLSIVIGVVLSAAAMVFAEVFGPPPSGELTWFVNAIMLFGLGYVWRGVSDFAGGVLQSRRLLWLDNSIVILGELAFITLVLLSHDAKYGRLFESIGFAYCVTGAIVAVARWGVAWFPVDASRALRLDRPVLGRLLGAAALVSVGSFADFLYAPMNCLLIGHYLGSKELAAYAPALQIDGALLLTIAAIAPVLMPRVAHAISQGDLAATRRLYLTASLAGVAVLTAGALVIVVLRGPLLELWLGQVPDETIGILPFVLVHTVIGGTAGVGRAVLLAMGRFRAYTLSAILGGVLNVALALLFVGHFGWGLRGIALATIVAVVVRCAIWMPWYVLRATRAPAQPAKSSS